MIARSSTTAAVNSEAIAIFEVEYIDDVILCSRLDLV